MEEVITTLNDKGLSHDLTFEDTKTQPKEWGNIVSFDESLNDEILTGICFLLKQAQKLVQVYALDLSL